MTNVHVPTAFERLTDACEGVQDAIDALMYVRSTTRQRRALDKLWWEINQRAADDLLKRCDSVMGDDRRH